MKATLEFTLPDEEEEFRRTANASKYLGALEDLANQLRNKAKHGEPETTWDAVKDLFWEVMGEAGIELL